MKYVVISAIFIICIGCASTGPQYSTLETTIPRLNEDQARFFFYRTKENALFFARKAPVTLNDKDIGATSYGSFFYNDVSPGRYVLKTEIWDMMGQCEISVEALAGSTYYFKIDPRTVTFYNFMFGHAVGSAIEPTEKGCSGAFKIYPAEEVFAKSEMQELSSVQ